VGKKKHMENKEQAFPETQDGLTGEAAPAETAVAEQEGAENPLAALEADLAACKAEAEQNRDLYLRARADMDNLRKRAQRDKEDFARFANEGILKEIIPVLDNLERAIEHAGANGGQGEGLLQGVEMTISQFTKVLEKFNVRPVESKGQPFDPSLHEAVGHLEVTDLPPNTVAQELQKGYLLHDRLLRPALVLVSKTSS